MSPVPALILALAGLGAAGYALWRARRQREQMDELCRQVEHFLLYSGAPLEGNLDEGALANLANQVSRLERQLLHQEESSRRREGQMTRFVENMIHQMKNAVTALQIQLDLLALHAGAEERDCLQKSQACMERLTGEIDRILKSSQLAAGKITMDYAPLDLRREVESCAERLRAIARDRQVAVELEGPEKLILSGDRFWLSQAVENILKNALEHTGEGTTVTLRLTDEGRQVRLRVEDQGPGIPREELPGLFLRFSRGSVTKAGYGIGLAMAKDIISAHHGEITAGNRGVGGAWFEVILPVLEGTRIYGS